MATFPLLDVTLFTAKREDQIYQYEGIVTWQIGAQETRLRAGAYDRRSNYDTQNNSGFILSTGYVARF